MKVEFSKPLPRISKKKGRVMKIFTSKERSNLKKLQKPNLKQSTQKSRPKTSQPNKINFDTLSTQTHSTVGSRQKVTIDEVFESGVPLTSVRTKQAVQNYLQQNNLRHEKIAEYSSHARENELLKSTRLNFHFSAPEQTDRGDFNEIDKVLYSFKKRMYISYINSLIKSYEQLLLEKPLIKKAIREEKHVLTGKILFDKKGNIVKINILKSSLSDEVHSLFESTLTGIQSLPNPPKMIIEDRDNFTVYYQLSIN